MWRTILALLFSTAVIAGPVPDGAIRVTGAGQTFEEAKKDAFRRAVEIAVGTTIVSNYATNGNVAVKNQILAYSSGYVTQYVVVSQEARGNGVGLVVDVWVASNRIAGRILSANSGERPLQGHAMVAQAKTWTDSRADADRVLLSTLADWPEKGYNVVTTSTKLVVDSRRKPLIEVGYRLNYNNSWVVAFKETMMAVGEQHKHGDRALVLFMDNPGAFLPSNRLTGVALNDMTTFGKIRMWLEGADPRLKATLWSGNLEVYSECISINKMALYNHRTHHDGVEAVKFFTAAETSGKVLLPLDISSATNNEPTEVKLEVVKKADCRN